MKTSNMIGNQLDWAVAICEGAICVREGENAGRLHWPSPKFGAEPKWSLNAPAYSTDWSISGPILEQNEIQLKKVGIKTWRARIDLDEGDAMIQDGEGETQLIAAMRCYVLSVLGDEVDVPADFAARIDDEAPAPTA